MAAIAIMHLVLCALLTNKLCVCVCAGQAANRKKRDICVHIYIARIWEYEGWATTCGLIEISKVVVC